MTVEDVIALIKEHRNQHLPSAIGGDYGDPLRWSEGGALGARNSAKSSWRR